MRLALHALDVRQRLARHCGQRQARLCRLGAAQPACRLLATASTPAAQTSCCTAPDVTTRPVPRSFATVAHGAHGAAGRELFDGTDAQRIGHLSRGCAARRKQRCRRKAARRGCRGSMEATVARHLGRNSCGAAGVGAVWRRWHRRRQRRLSVQMDCPRIPITAAEFSPLPPPPRAARSGRAAVKTAERAADKGAAAAGAMPARLDAAPPRGTNRGTNAQSWAYCDSAFDMRLNDVPINKLSHSSAIIVVERM